MEELTPQQKHRELIKAQIVGSFNNIEELIEKSTIAILDPLIKGEIAQNFDNRDSSIRFIKLGREIKERLQNLLNEHQTSFILLKDKLTDLVSKIGKEPDEKNDYNWYDFKVNYQPLKYNWKLCYPEDVSSKVSSFNEPQEPKVIEGDKLCLQYNKCVEEIIDCQVEQEMIKIMLNNFEDDKEYPLTIKQGVILRF